MQFTCSLSTLQVVTITNQICHKTLALPQMAYWNRFIWQKSFSSTIAGHSKIHLPSPWSATSQSMSGGFVWQEVPCSQETFGVPCSKQICQWQIVLVTRSYHQLRKMDSLQLCMLKIFGDGLGTWEVSDSPTAFLHFLCILCRVKFSCEPKVTKNICNTFPSRGSVKTKFCGKLVCHQWKFNERNGLASSLHPRNLETHDWSWIIISCSLCRSCRQTRLPKCPWIPCLTSTHAGTSQPKCLAQLLIKVVFVSLVCGPSCAIITAKTPLITRSSCQTLDLYIRPPPLQISDAVCE